MPRCAARSSGRAARSAASARRKVWTPVAPDARSRSRCTGRVCRSPRSTLTNTGTNDAIAATATAPELARGAEHRVQDRGDRDDRDDGDGGDQRARACRRWAARPRRARPARSAEQRADQQADEGVGRRDQHVLDDDVASAARARRRSRPGSAARAARRAARRRRAARARAMSMPDGDGRDEAQPAGQRRADRRVLGGRGSSLVRPLDRRAVQRLAHRGDLARSTPATRAALSSRVVAEAGRDDRR